MLISSAVILVHFHFLILSLLQLPYVNTSMAIEKVFASKYNANQTNLEYFLKELILFSSHRNEGIIFHFDERLTETWKDIIDYTEMYPSLFSPSNTFDAVVIDYSKYDISFQRPLGFGFINIVFLRQPYKIHRFLDNARNTGPKDKVLFVLSTEYLKRECLRKDKAFWKQHAYLSKLTNTVFITPTKVGIEVYDTCYYCGAHTGSLRHIGIWKDIQESKKNQTKFFSEIFRDNFKDFNGHEFRVLFNNIPPYVWCSRKKEVPRLRKNGTERICARRLTGPEGINFSVISRFRNFTVRAVDFTSWPESNFPIPGEGTADTLLRQVTAGKCDIAIAALSVSWGRYKYVHFTDTSYLEPLNFVHIHRPGDTTGLTGPFSTTVWICLAGSWLASASLFLAVTKDCQLDSHGVVLWVTGALLGQGTRGPSHLLQNRATRYFLLLWGLYSLILISLYQSNLVSSLIKPVPDQEPSTLEDLLAQKYEIIARDLNLFYVASLGKSSDPLYRTVARKIKLYKTQKICNEILTKAWHDKLKTALIGEDLELRWGIDHWDDIEPHIRRSLKLGKKETSVSGHAWAVQNQVLVQDFNTILHSLLASGLSQLWIREYNRTRVPKPHEKGGVCPEAFTESCKQEQLIQCTDPVKLFSDNKDLPFFTDLKAIDKLCPQLMEGLKCVDEYTQRCMKTMDRASFHKLYSGIQSVFTNLCMNETYKRDFIRHQPCVVEVHKHHELCAKDFQERIQLAGRVGEGALGFAAAGSASDAGEDANMASSGFPKRVMTPEESQEYMKRVCCSFQGYLTCSKEPVLDTCGSEAAKFTEGYLDAMAMPLIESHCKDHYVGSENCAELLAQVNSSSWAKSSPLTLFLPLLALAVAPFANLLATSST